MCLPPWTWQCLGLETRLLLARVSALQGGFLGPRHRSPLASESCKSPQDGTSLSPVQAQVPSTPGLASLRAPSRDGGEGCALCAAGAAFQTPFVSWEGMISGGREAEANIHT